MPVSSSRRIKFAGLELEQLPDGRERAVVNLEWRGQSFTGTHECDASPEQRLQCAGTATAAGLRSAVGGGAEFEVLDMETAAVLGASAVVVALAIRHGAQTRYSVGICLVRDDPAESAVRAVLNGSNRYLSQLLGSEG
jgi:hypothetical protein